MAAMSPRDQRVKKHHMDVSWMLALLATCQTGLHSWVTQSAPGQNGRHFADDIFRCIFVNEIFFILIKISLKFVPKGPIDDNPALV